MAEETKRRNMNAPFTKQEIIRVLKEYNTFDPATGELLNAKILGARMSRPAHTINNLVVKLTAAGAKVNIVRKGEYYKTAITDIRASNPELFHKVREATKR